MLNNRLRAAQKVAAQLTAAEADLDRAMQSLVALTTTMIEAREVAGVSHVIGQKAFDRVGEATQNLFQTRSKVIDAHLSLAEARDQVGLRVVGLGALQDCPPMSASGGEPANVVSIAG